MLVGLFVILVAWSDFFFAGISTRGRFLAQPSSPGSSFLSTPMDWVEGYHSVRLIGNFKMEIPTRATNNPTNIAPISYVTLHNLEFSS